MAASDQEGSEMKTQCEASDSSETLAGDSYTKMTGFATTHGQDYEVKMSALLFVRGLNSKGEFQLATNVAGAGAFDDIVFKFTTLDKVCHTSFIQLKHKESAKQSESTEHKQPGNHEETGNRTKSAKNKRSAKIKDERDESDTHEEPAKDKKKAEVNMDALVNLKGNFSLTKYFEAYMKIKESFKGNTGLYSGRFESSHFTIFTNTPLENRKEVADTCEEPSIVNEQVKQNEEDKGGVETRDLPSPIDEYIKLNEVKASFTEDCIEKLYSILKKEEVKQKKLPKHLMSLNENDAKDFLRRLKLFTGQPSEDQLDDVIKEELKKFGIEKDIDIVLRIFLEKMKAWWEHKDGVILNQKSTILLQAQADAMLPHVEKLSQQEENKFKLNIKFLESSTVGLKDTSADQVCLVNVPSQQLVRMTASKVLQILEPQRGKYIFLSLESLLKEREAVMSSWRHGKNDLLVLVCNQTTDQEKEIVAELSRVLDEGKKLILISDSGDSFATQLREKMLPNCLPIVKDFFHMSQLDPDSISSILQKEVVLQGTPTILGAMIGEDLDCISNELKDVIETIITSESLIIGDKLKEGISYYMPRTMQYKRVVKKEIFSDKKYAGRIIIRGASLSDVDDFIHTGEQKMKKKFQQSREGLVFNGEDDEDEKKYINTRDDVHYLELIDRILVWKKTKGDINLIKDYLDESDWETTDDPDDRVVLLIAEPGMGKTTQLAHVAQQTKQQHPNCWVLPVTLNEHETILAHTKDNYLNAEAYLHSVMGIEKMSSVAQALFKICLNHTGNVMGLIDGCDEISPKYTDKCLALVQSLLKTKVKKVWIASRHSVKNNLESTLSTLATGLRKFNKEDQRGFLVKYWKRKENRDVKPVKLSDDELQSFITKLLNMTAQSINDKENELLGIPLQTRMLGEVFLDNVINKDMVLPTKLNALELIEHFVKKKCRTYCERTVKMSKTNSDFDSILDDQLSLFYDKHSATALILLLGEAELQLLLSFDMERCNKFMANIVSGADKTGIIDMIVDGKPVFIHRVFAEFFAAHWLSKTFHKNIAFMSQHLLGETFGVIRQMFNRILARGNELHEAVLNADISRVEEKMREKCNENSTDKGRRTALHLAVMAGLDNRSRDNPSIQIIRLLLTHKARVDLKDKVLQWTPVEYADESKLLAELDILLKHAKLNITELRTTVQNINNEDMWKTVLKFDYANVLNALLDICKIKNITTANFSKINNEHPEEILLIAIENGSTEITRMLITRTSRVSTKMSNAIDGYSEFERSALKKLLYAQDGMSKRNALITAVLCHNIAIVKILLDSFSNPSDRIEYINLCDDQRRSAVWFAGRQGYLDIIQLLVDSGVDVRARGPDGATALLEASRKGHTLVVKALLDAIINESDRVEYVNTCDDEGMSPLWWAKLDRHQDIVQLLRPYVSEVPKTDFNKLMEASKQGCISDVRELLAQFTNESDRAEYVNTCDGEGRLALWLASVEGHNDIVQLLINSGADVTTRRPGGAPTLMAASYAGQIQVVRTLLAAISNESDRAEYVNTCDDKGRCALWCASWKGHHDIVQLLINSGADLTTRRHDGDSALMTASSAGQVQVVTVLLAAFKNESDRVEFVNTVDDKGRSALYYASEKGHHAIVQLQIVAGADVTACGPDGFTALMAASVQGHGSVVRALLSAFNNESDKAEYVNSCDDKGRSALWLANSNDHHDIVQLLMSAGAEVTTLQES